MLTCWLTRYQGINITIHPLGNIHVGKTFQSNPSQKQFNIMICRARAKVRESRFMSSREHKYTYTYALHSETMRCTRAYVLVLIGRALYQNWEYKKSIYFSIFVDGQEESLTLQTGWWSLLTLANYSVYLFLTTHTLNWFDMQ